MGMRGAGRWWLAAALTLRSAHALGPAHAPPAPDDGVLRGLWGALDVSPSRIDPFSPGEPGPRRLAGDWMPAPCVSEQSILWLPRIALPHPDRAGQLALDWRLDDDPEHRRVWLAVTGAVAALSLALAVALRRRRGGRRLAWLVALGPVLVGLILSHHVLARAAEGLSVPWSCVPLEKIVLLVPSPETPWREVALVREAFDRERPDRDVRLRLRVLGDRAQGEPLLERQRAWLEAHRYSTMPVDHRRRREQWEQLTRAP
ncbi:MAG: hypothetical protein EOO75_15560 [Myxococcales bacterium]|nr:MAG: hypothetical protein EOO75_15560 [Myxococcales bacterium]